MKADKSNYYAYNRHLQPYASKLRKRMTKAEACLWKYVLKGRKMKGYSFRRQRSVLNYIADFMCKDLMLVIEVDGFTHLLEETKIKDRRKERDLEQAGFTVLRFTDEEVLRHIDRVMEKLEIWIEERDRDPLRVSRRGKSAPPCESTGGGHRAGIRITRLEHPPTSLLCHYPPPVGETKGVEGQIQNL